MKTRLGAGTGNMVDDEIFKDTRNWTVSRKRGQVIFDAGDPSRQMYRVESGCVRLQLNGLKGERQIIVFLLPGDLFGFEIDKRVCSAEAASDCLLRCWPVDAVLKPTPDQANLTIKQLEEAQSRFAEMAEHIEKIIHLPAKERVIWFLNGLLSCRGLPKTGQRMHLPMSHVDIADYLGLAPETLSRVISGLEEDGYLRRTGRHDLELDLKAFPKVRSPTQLLARKTSTED